MKSLATVLIVPFALLGCATSSAPPEHRSGATAGQTESTIVSIPQRSSDEEGNEVVAIPRGVQKPPAAHAANVDAIAKGILAQTNQFRVSQGQQAVVPERRLQAAAQQFASYMARTGHYGHTADGRRPGNRAGAAGYRFCIVGENIAYQFRSSDFTADELAQRFTQGWINSPSHRKNMLDPDVTETAVSAARSEDGVYYGVQLFGRPDELRVNFTVTNPSEKTVRYTIGQTPFSLSPGMSRTHGESRPPVMTVENAASPVELHPKRGGTYVLTPGAEGRVRVETK